MHLRCGKAKAKDKRNKGRLWKETDEVKTKVENIESHFGDPAVLVSVSALHWRLLLTLDEQLPSRNQTQTHTYANHLYRTQCFISAPAGPVGDATLTIICIDSIRHESRAAIPYEINSAGLSGAEDSWCNEEKTHTGAYIICVPSVGLILFQVMFRINFLC